MTPGRFVTLNENDVLSPKIDARTVAAAELKVEWPDAYSGKAGVTSSGVQLSADVAAELTEFASGMAWIGRQDPYVYFTSQSAIAASASAVFRMANIRTLADRLRPCAFDTVWAMVFHNPAGVDVPVPALQNWAICVWSVVRVVLLAEPRLSTWFRSVAHCADVKAGGGPICATS